MGSFLIIYPKPYSISFRGTYTLLNKPFLLLEKGMFIGGATIGWEGSESTGNCTSDSRLFKC